AAGTANLGNSFGIELQSGGVQTPSLNNIIGGTVPGAGNLISGNFNSGIRVNSQQAVIQGNLIGTNFSGTSAIGNGTGIFASVFGTPLEVIIGGTAPGARNVISGNTGDGVY